MNQNTFNGVKKDLSLVQKANLIQRMMGTIGKDEFPRKGTKEEMTERVIVDLDIKQFIKHFFFPFTVSLDPKKENAILNYMADELAVLKQGKELADRRNLVKELIERPDFKEKIEEFVKEGYNLMSLLEKREEMIGSGEWRKDLIYLSEHKTREFIRIDYQILKVYIFLVEIIKKIESKTDFIKNLKRIESQINNNEHYRDSKEMIEKMNNFGEARLCIRYDYFSKVKDVFSIKFNPKEKKIKETLGWYLKKWKNKHKGFLCFGASREERFYAEALDFLVLGNLSKMAEISAYPIKLEFFLGGLRYIKKIKSANLPFTFPSFERRKGFSVEELCNPCLLLQGFVKIVPNDIQFNPKENVAVITGPNDSGKTVYVQSIGLAYCLGQNGFPVLAKEAKLSEMKDVITHFVSPGDITRGEGMFLNELRRIKELFIEADEKSLLIVDEPIRGSSFEDAQEMTLRFIDGFLSLGAPTFLTTHLHSVAEKVSTRRGVKNLRTKIDKNRKPAYKIVPGREKSYGVEIANKFGLTKSGILNLIKRKKKR